MRVNTSMEITADSTGSTGGLPTVTFGTVAVACGFLEEGSYHLHLCQPDGLPQGKGRGEKRDQERGCSVGHTRYPKLSFHVTHCHLKDVVIEQCQ